MASPIPVPEGTPVKRTLHFFWLTDYSGSMSGTKIATLNQAFVRHFQNCARRLRHTLKCRS